MTTDTGIEARLAAVEARLDIGQLPIRYAIAVDTRDIDAWVNLFVPDVNCGRHGVGRDALKSYITPLVRQFYRSIHQICGHRVELTGPDTAVGDTYCRAEHEVGDRWVVMGIWYRDAYRRVDGAWCFERRDEKHWYAADVDTSPPTVDFVNWGGSPAAPLPKVFPESWNRFWAGVDTSAITAHPTHAT